MVEKKIQGGTKRVVVKKELTAVETAARALEERPLERKEYRALKRDLIGLEEENVSEIILQKCAGEGDWFEIAEHSALIYYHYVCQMLKIKNVRFEDDYDSFYEQYKIGRIRTRGIGTVRERLVATGLYGSEHIINNRAVFVLKKSLTKDKLRQLERKEAKRRMNLNKTVEVVHSDPLFYRNLSELMRRFHRICSSKLDKISSQTNGARIVALTDGIMADYLHSTDLPAKDLTRRMDDWKKIRSKLYRLKYEIQIIEIAGLWSMETCLGAFETTEELKKLADANLAKTMREKSRNEKTSEAS